MGIPPDGAGGGGRGLDGTEGGATGGERSTEKGVGRVGVTVVDQSVDWNASFASRAWSILRAATYQACGSVSVGRPKGMVVRATGHKTPGESSVNITVSSYDTTHL